MRVAPLVRCWVCHKSAITIALTVALTIVLTVALTAASAHAQSTEPPDEKYWLMGGTLGVVIVDGDFIPQVTLLGVHATSVNPGTLGVDVSASIAPYSVAYRAIAGTLTAGVAVPYSVSPDVLLMPRAGATFVYGAGAGVGAETGLYAGGSLATVRVSTVGVRLGLTAHWFRGVGTPVWLLEFGLARGR